MPSCGDLAEHVLVQVALMSLRSSGSFIERIDRFGEQVRRRNGEPGILHMVRVGRVVSAEPPQPREDPFGDESGTSPRVTSR